MTEKPKPKKCPFCGWLAITIGFANCDGVRCSGCGATGPLCSTEEEAIRRWNTRHEEGR